MEQQWIMSAAIGASVAIGLVISSSLQRKRSGALATRIAPLLREQGAMTLPALAEALGMKGFIARGKVALALNDLVAIGTIELIDAPPGTPQLEKVNVLRYRLRAA